METTVLRSSARYAAGVFAVGCVLGTLREMALAPKLGRTAALAIETPLMLVTCAGFSLHLTRRTRLPPATAARVGATALPLLRAMEEALTLTLRRHSMLNEWRRQPRRDVAITAVGLLGFTIMPLLVQLGWSGKLPPRYIPALRRGR